ncbi:MAG: aminotransferase class V-fold PLP-dependent enzyme [Thermomicrobiaceae bacterium]
MAQLINASSSEIALTRNASDGINYVLAGLAIPAESTIITTSEEHPAVLLPLALAQQSLDGNVAMLDLGESDDAILERLGKLLTAGGTSLAIFSHVSCETGRRLPIEGMCALCRRHGVWTLVDGAQSVGQFGVDVAAIGCDFMTGNGHKWLCGPKGTGFLYIQEDRINDLVPPYAGDGSVDPRFDRTRFSGDGVPPDWGFRGDAQRFEFGTRNWHLYGAVADSIDELRELGFESIQNHVAALSSNLKAALRERRGVAVHTPDRWDDSCGLVTFSVDGWEGTTLSDRLWTEHNIIQRRVQIPSAVRISCAHYSSQDDIDQFLNALDLITA